MLGRSGLSRRGWPLVAGVGHGRTRYARRFSSGGRLAPPVNRTQEDPMAFLRFPAKAGTKGATPTTQAPRAIPRAVPKPVARPAPGPTTVTEASKQRMGGLGTARVGRQYTILGAIFVMRIAAADF